MKKNNPILYCLPAPIFLAQVVGLLHGVCFIIFIIILVNLIRFYSNKKQKPNAKDRQKMELGVLWAATLVFLLFSEFVIPVDGYYVFFLSLGLAVCFNFCLGLVLKVYKFKILYLLLAISLSGFFLSVYNFISVEYKKRPVDIDTYNYQACQEADATGDINSFGSLGCWAIPTGGSCDDDYWY